MQAQWGTENAWVLFCECVAVVAPALAVLWAVFRESKLVAAVAQLGGLQERDQQRRNLISGVIQVDKNWFILGVTNFGASPYILGAWPSKYYLLYTPKVISLIILRLVTFRKKKQHFLLWDFCYWANYLCIFYVWVKPNSLPLFITVFFCANGPLAWSVPAFNHAMIFHSYAHVTSVVIHTSPILLTYGLRWYSDVCDSACLEIPFYEMVGGTLVRFYLWWLIVYYLWIFVALGSYIEKNGYQTLWDRILVMKPIGPLLKKLLTKFPKLVVQLVYLLIHLGFSTMTMLVAVVLWRSQFAHFFFMTAILLATVRNGAQFYFEVFESYYKQVVGGDGGATPGTDLRKKITAASPALVSLSQPLA